MKVKIWGEKQIKLYQKSKQIKFDVDAVEYDLTEDEICMLKSHLEAVCGIENLKNTILPISKRYCLDLFGWNTDHKKEPFIFITKNYKKYRNKVEYIK